MKLVFTHWREFACYLLFYSCDLSYKEEKEAFLLNWEEEVILEPGELEWNMEEWEYNIDSRGILNREDAKTCFWSCRASSLG